MTNLSHSFMQLKSTANEVFIFWFLLAFKKVLTLISYNKIYYVDVLSFSQPPRLCKYQSNVPKLLFILVKFQKYTFKILNDQGVYVGLNIKLLLYTFKADHL